jgi:DNA replication protein DnaC
LQKRRKEAKMKPDMALVKLGRPPEHDPGLPGCPLCGAPAYKGYRFTRPDEIEHDCDCAYARWPEYYAALERAWRRYHFPRVYRETLPEGYREFLERPFRAGGNEEAVRAVEAWAEKGGLLYLHGPAGAGKTHLAVRAGLRRAERGHRVLFKTEIDFLDEVRRGVLEGEEAFEPKGDLVLDGVGTGRATPLALEALFALLERARVGQLALLATGTLPPEELAKRFGEGTEAVAARLEGRTALLAKRRSPDKVPAWAG